MTDHITELYRQETQIRQWFQIASVLVVVGVLVEVVLELPENWHHFKFKHPEFKLSKVFMVIAGFAVVFGVGGEWWFDIWSEQIQTQIRDERDRTENILRQENLEMQRSMMSRHVDFVGIDGIPKAKKFFAGLEKFAGTEVVIQFAPDLEAENLAREIALAVAKFGWKPKFVNESRTHLTLGTSSEGLEVFYPVGEPWAKDYKKSSYFKWGEAAKTLARGLTNAKLGVCESDVQDVGFTNEPGIPFGPYFDPPLTGIYLQVGLRPVRQTVDHLEQRREQREQSPDKTPWYYGH